MDVGDLRTMRDTRRHADRLVGHSAARRFRIFLSVSETWKTECHRRVDGSAGSNGVAVVVAASSAGHSGAASRQHGSMCPPPLRGRSAVVAQNAAYPSGGGQRSPRMSILTRRRHGGITSPCARQVGASLRRPQRSPQGSASFSESSDCAKSHTRGLVRTAPPSGGVLALTCRRRACVCPPSPPRLHSHPPAPPRPPAEATSHRYCRGRAT